MDALHPPGIEDHDVAEVHLVARGSRPRSPRRPGSPTCRRTCSRRSPARSPGIDVDYRALEPLGPDELADVLGRARPRLPPADRPSHGARRARAAADPDRRGAPGREVRRGARHQGRLRPRRAPVRAGRVRAGVEGPPAQRVRRARPGSRRRRSRGRHRATGRGALRPVRARRGRSRARGAAGRPSRTSPRNRWATRCGRCTTAAASRSPARPAARRRTSRSTTSCTCSPTTARTSRASSRSSRSSGGPIPTRRASRGWPR